MKTRNKHIKNFRDSIVSGIGWSVGVTVGFALISTFLVVFVARLGGLPLVGNGIAAIVDATNQSLIQRTPIKPHN